MAERADAQGFYSVSINDHFFAPGQKPEAPQLECFTTLSAIAAVTKRVRIAPAMTAMSFRNPALLAKMASTLDVISNGRLTLGVGSGWMRDEYHAHDYPYPTNRQRLDQLKEAIKLIKAMWTMETPTYHGPFFKVEKAFNHPRPIQQPHPPIMVGGSGRKLLEISAAEADIANLRAAADPWPARRRRYGEVRQAPAQAKDRDAPRIRAGCRTCTRGDRDQRLLFTYARA